MAQEAKGEDGDHGDQGGASGQTVESVDQVEGIGDEKNPKYGEQKIDSGADGMSGEERTEDETKVVDSETRKIKKNRRTRLDGDLRFRLKGFDVVISAHEENEQNRNKNAKVAFCGDADVEGAGDRNVGQSGGHEGDTNGDPAQPRQGLGVQVAAVDRRGLETVGNGGGAHPIGQERRNGDGGGQHQNVEKQGHRHLLG